MKHWSNVLTSLFGAILLTASCAHGQSVVNCANSLSVSTATLTAPTQLIAAPATSAAIHICSYVVQVQQGATAVNWGFVSGTGSVCSAGAAAVTPMFLGSAGAQQSIAQTYGSTNTLNLPSGQALCFALSGAPTGAVVQVTYAVY